MTRAELLLALNEHDWFYEFSDDARDWQRGGAERSRIARELSKLPETEYVELITQYARGTDTVHQWIIDNTLREVRRMVEFRNQNKGDV